MTGPLFFTRHPHRRRARLLLPFAAAIMLGQLACTSDQSTEPPSSIQAAPLVATTGPHPRAKLASRALVTSTPKSLVTLKASASFGIAQASSGNGPSVLILADTDVVATSALAASLADSGVQVTIRPAPEYTWDGTNPSLSGFDVVVHLNGTTYDYPLSSEAQTALTSFVANGGGFVGAQWNGYEPQPELNSLILQGIGNDPEGPSHNCTACDVTFERLAAGEGHPVLAGLPASFTVPADGHDAGPAAEFATALMQVSSGGPAVLVRELGSGRVVNFSFAPNYPWNDEGLLHELVTLQDPTVQHLYLNAVRWAGGSGEATAVPQTITFDPLGNKVYGEPAFSVSASASSNLPVNFTASGDCGVVGSTVTIAAAGSCTITAHQAGNDEYLAAEDVSRSFAIVKATATITVGTEYTFDGSPKFASLTTNPSGLDGVTATYALNGLPVTQPVNAGVYQVLATLDNPNYQAAPAIGTLTIVKAPATITAVDAELIFDGIAKSADVTTSPSPLSGVAVTYTLNGFPVTQPINPGVYQFVAALDNPNYQAAPRTGTLTIVQPTATITAVGSLFTFDGTAKSANVTTSPSSLSGVTVTYTLNGLPVAQPINAGAYQFVATLQNPIYVANPASGMLIIKPAKPVINWEPGRIWVGTPLSPAQLNATATGVGGAMLAGSFSYSPPAGTRLKAGNQTLLVQFTPADTRNYTGASKTVVINVETGKKGDLPVKKKGLKY